MFQSKLTLVSSRPEIEIYEIVSILTTSGQINSNFAHNMSFFGRTELFYDSKRVKKEFSFFSVPQTIKKKAVHEKNETLRDLMNK